MRYVAVVIVAVLALLAGWLLSSNLDTHHDRFDTGIGESNAMANARTATAANDARHANAPEQVAPAAPAVSNPPASTSASHRTPMCPRTRVVAPTLNRTPIEQPLRGLKARGRRRRRRLPPAQRNRLRPRPRPWPRLTQCGRADQRARHRRAD